MGSFTFFVVAGNAVATVDVTSNNAQFATLPALTAVRIAGCIIAVISFHAPLFTFVQPVLEEGSVGDRMVYTHLIAFFNNVMWTLYASTDLPKRIMLLIIIGWGTLFQFFYINFYIYYADGKKRLHALILLLAVLVLAFIIAELVVSMVLTHRWSSTFIDVMASASGTSMLIFPVFDVVMVMKSKRVNNMNLITSLISLFGASIWTLYGFLSAPVNYYVLAPNLPGIPCAVLQIVIYLIYDKTVSNSVKAGRAPNVSGLDCVRPMYESCLWTMDLFVNNDGSTLGP